MEKVTKTEEELYAQKRLKDQDEFNKAYNADSTNADLTVADNRFTFDSISPFLYMKISYTSGASTGTFSIIALV